MWTDTQGYQFKTGMLYLFFNGALESRVIHWQGSTADLEIREYPEPPTLPDAEHYLSDFLQGETIELRPHWIMHLNEGELFDYRDVHRLLPEELVVELSDKLDAPLASWDCRRRLYGKPLCFQGEDEPVPWRKPETRMVLFQDPFGDAIVHFMCDPEAAARGDFSAVEVTASCT